MKYAKYFFAFLFAFGAIVQFNDPDAFLWIIMYAVASAVCIASALKPAIRWPTLVVGTVALGWGLYYVPTVVGSTPFGDMFGAWEMQNEGIEKSREMYGLLIISAWMFFMAYRDRSRASTN